MGTHEACVKGSDHGRTIWREDEDALIVVGVRRYGLKWRKISATLEGRSDSSVRNRWQRLTKDRDFQWGQDLESKDLQLGSKHRAVGGSRIRNQDRLLPGSRRLLSASPRPNQLLQLVGCTARAPARLAAQIDCGPSSPSVGSPTIPE